MVSSVPQYRVRGEVFPVVSLGSVPLRDWIRLADETVGSDHPITVDSALELDDAVRKTPKGERHPRWLQNLVCRVWAARNAAARAAGGAYVTWDEALDFGLDEFEVLGVVPVEAPGKRAARTRAHSAAGAVGGSRARSGARK